MKRAITRVGSAVLFASLVAAGPALHTRQEAVAQAACGAWTNIGGDDDATATTLAVRSTNEVWIGGNRLRPDVEKYEPFVRFWNGAQWQEEETAEFDFWGSLSAMDVPDTGAPIAVGGAGFYGKPVALRRVLQSLEVTLPPSEPSFAWQRTDTERARNAFFTGVEVIDDQLAWAAGMDHGRDPNRAQPLLQRWDGHKWEKRAVDLNGGLWEIDGTSRSNIWAVGIQKDGKRSRPLTLHFNGRRWRSIPTPDADRRHDWLEAVAVVGRHSAWAVGVSQEPRYPGYARPLILRWNGHRWRKVDPPELPRRGSASQGVLLSGVSVHRDARGADVVVVGRNQDPSGKNGLIWTRWRGEWTWEDPAAPPDGHSLDDVEHSPDGHVFAVGNGYYYPEGEQMQRLNVVWHRTPRC